MRIQFVGMMTMSSLSLAQSIMQATGNMVTPMKIGITYRLLQIILCPLLVFGWSIFPEMGVRGAAYSNVITQGIGATIALWVVFSGKTRVRPTLKHFRFDWGLVWRQLKIGLPSMFANIERNFAGLILVGFITPFGTVAVAAHSLSARVDSFAQMLPNAFANPAGVLAAQNLGAKHPERAERTVWTGMVLAISLGLLIAATTYFLAVPIIHIFNSEPNLVAITASFVRIQAVSYMIWGIVITMTNSLNILGDTLITMISQLVTAWGVQMSLAYFLPHVGSLGVLGVRWSMVAAIVGRAIILPVYFKTGRWKRKKV